MSNINVNHCYCVLITRRDGRSLGFTSLDCDLVINSVTYKSNSAIAQSATSKKTDLSADNLEIKALIQDNQLLPFEINTGVYDRAIITTALVDFVNLPSNIDNAIVLLKGEIGEVTITDTSITFEVRDLSDRLSRPISKKTSPLCSHIFGDSKCAKNLVSSNLLLSNIPVTAVSGNNITFNTSFLNSSFVNGLVTFTTGNNKALPLEIKTVVGSTVTLSGLLPYTVAIGDQATIKAYCAKTEVACKAYGNFINTSLFPVGGNWIPGLTKITAIP